MRRIMAVTAVLLLIAGCSGTGIGTSSGLSRGWLVGTWELVASGMNQYRQIKTLTSSHFVWVTYERGTGVLVASGGGTYELDGTAYRERLGFVSDAGMLGLIGLDQVFTARRDGDRWHHAGTLTNGFKVDEIWRKLE
jgi:hypothetical protein